MMPLRAPSTPSREPEEAGQALGDQPEDGRKVEEASFGRRSTDWSEGTEIDGALDIGQVETVVATMIATTHRAIRQALLVQCFSRPAVEGSRYGGDSPALCMLRSVPFVKC